MSAPPIDRAPGRLVARLFGRTRRRRIIHATLVALLVPFAIDALAIEPFRVVVTGHVVAARITAPLVVAHLSDLHTQGLGRREERVLAAVEAAHVDAVFVTGDVVDDGDLEHARAFFDRLRSSHPVGGVFVVSGNWEHWRATADAHAFYASVGARYLENEGTELARGVYVGGVDDPTAGAPDLARAFATAPKDALRVALFHGPDLFDNLSVPVDLAFTGHTHGGQVRLPFLPPLWLPPGSGRFVEGWYRHGDARMYVSRGIGTSLLPIRFFCAPEVAVVRIEPM